MIEVLNEYFVPVEFNVAEWGGVPDDIPAMSVHYNAWNTIPYTRVAFSGEWVLSPDGQYLIANASCKHQAVRSADAMFSKSFGRMIEVALKRHARIRSHEPGSPEQLAEIERVKAEVDADLREIRPCWLGSDAMGEHLMKTLANQGDDSEGFEKKYAIVLAWPDPVVRRRGAEMIGAYAQRSGEVLAEVY